MLSILAVFPYFLLLQLHLTVLYQHQCVFLAAIEALYIATIGHKLTCLSGMLLNSQNLLVASSRVADVARAALTERSGSSTKGRTPNIRYFDRLSQGTGFSTKAILLS